MSTEHDPGSNEPSKKESKESGGLFNGIKKIFSWVKNAIAGLGVPSEEYHRHATELWDTLKSKTRNIISGVKAVSESVKDETDKKLVTEAVTFLEKPSENLADIMKHTTNVGHVLGGYKMQGGDAPPAIDAMHGHLFSLQAVDRIAFVEKELEKGSAVTPEMKHAATLASDWATIVSKGYKDSTLLSAVNDLQTRLNK